MVLPTGSLILMPKKFLEELERRGLTLEDALLDALSKVLNLDPEIIAESRLELAEKYLSEGKDLVDRDPVQASEKLYKAAEECVKALAIHLKIEDVLKSVEKRGRWTSTDLERAVKEISKRAGKQFLISWGEASYLHVWGFHEAKLDSESVKVRVEYIESMVEETKRLLRAH
jgi:hypothetical protein